MTCTEYDQLIMPFDTRSLILYFLNAHQDASTGHNDVVMAQIYHVDIHFILFFFNCVFFLKSYQSLTNTHYSIRKHNIDRDLIMHGKDAIQKCGFSSITWNNTDPS